MEKSSMVSDSNHNDPHVPMEDQESRDDADKSNSGGIYGVSEEIEPTASSTTQESTPMQPNNDLGDDEELEEGELKDDDDDDDDDDHDGEVVDGPAKTSRLNSDDSDLENRKRSNSSDSRKSSVEESSNCSSTNSGGNDIQKANFKAHSTRSSSSSIDRIHRPSSFSSRHDSKSRRSSRSHSRSRRLHSPSNSNHQARLVTMRAKLLEAKSREIEMKFQKNKAHLTSSLSTISVISGIGNLKSTLAKPSITYAENPNATDDSSEPKKRSKSVKKSEAKDKSKTTKKLSKKRKKKSSPKKKKKRIKTSEASRKGENSDKTNSVSTEPSNDNIDRQGPKTPPDNQVLTLDDEQVEWPSYLIKMTTTQPSISYSVNPDSVVESNPTSRSDNSDLNVDFSWYYNYFINTFNMDKLQAQHQACSTLISVKNYDKDVIDRWLEQQGFSIQPDTDEDKEIPRDVDDVTDAREYSSVPLKTSKPPITTLRSNREIVLPNGKILPRGTIQKIVHPYPKTERVTPELTHSFFDLY